MHPEVLNVEGAARVLGVSRWTILKLVRRGDIPGVKVGKSWRFRLQALLRWLGKGPESNGGESLAPAPTVEDATAALRGLGYRGAEAEALVLDALEVLGRHATVEQLVRQAVKR